MSVPPCIVCRKPMQPAFSHSHEFDPQPNDGVMCTTYGNYGSTVYDQPERHRSHLLFIVCDACLVAAGVAGLILEFGPRPPQPRVPGTVWNPPTDGEANTDGIRRVYQQDLGVLDIDGRKCEACHGHMHNHTWANLDPNGFVVDCSNRATMSSGGAVDTSLPTDAIRVSWPTT